MFDHTLWEKVSTTKEAKICLLSVAEIVFTSIFIAPFGAPGSNKAQRK